MKLNQLVLSTSEKRIVTAIAESKGFYVSRTYIGTGSDDYGKWSSHTIYSKRYGTQVLEFDNDGHVYFYGDDIYGDKRRNICYSREEMYKALEITI